MFDYDVFLSFSAKDTEIVKPIWQRLSLSGLRVFWSNDSLKQNIGTSFFTVIQDALVNSRNFVLYWSANVPESAWVQQEYETFYSQCYLHDKSSRRLILLCKDSSSISSLPPFLRTIQFARSTDDLVSILGGMDLESLKKKARALEEAVERLQMENASLRRQLEVASKDKPTSDTKSSAHTVPERNAVAQLKEKPQSTFLIRDKSGFTHVVQTDLTVQFGSYPFGSGYYYQVPVYTGALKKNYNFSGMSSIKMNKTSDRVIVTFTLPDRPGELVGEIEIPSDYQQYATNLHIRTLEGDSATLRLEEVDWPVELQ